MGLKRQGMWDVLATGNILYFILKARKAPFMFIYEHKKNELCLRKIIMVTCEKYSGAK